MSQQENASPEEIEKKIEKYWKKMNGASDNESCMKYQEKLIKLNNKFRKSLGVEQCVRF